MNLTSVTNVPSSVCISKRIEAQVMHLVLLGTRALKTRTGGYPGYPDRNLVNRSYWVTAGYPGRPGMSNCLPTGAVPPVLPGYPGKPVLPGKTRVTR